MTEPRYIIRCRETGLFLWRAGDDCQPIWVEQGLADRFCASSARRQLDLLESFKHCCHIVPEEWCPAWEADRWITRVRGFLRAIWSFFKH